MQQLAQAEKQTQTASEHLARSSTQAAAGLAQQGQAASAAAGQTSTMERAAREAAEALQREQREALAAAEALHKTGAAASNASTLMQRLGSAVGNFGQQAGAFAVAQFGVESLQSALRGVANFATSSLQAALHTETLTAAFKAIEGSGKAAGQTMQWLKDQANRLGVDVVALSNGFKTVDAATRGTILQGESIRKIFVAMAEASRVLGLSSQDLNGVLLAVGQSISKGTVQAEELRGQIGERLPGAFQIAARAIGVTTVELDKMMERGELQATTFWPKFGEQIRKEFGGSVDEASKTASAAFERFHNATQEFKVNVGQSVIPPLTWIVDKLNAVVGAANKAAQAIKDVGKAGRDAAQEAQTLAGGKEVAPALQQQFVAAQAAEQQARDARQRLQGSTWEGDKTRLAAAQEAENTAIAKRIALGKQLEAAKKTSEQTGDPFGEGVETGGRDETRVAFQQKLTDQVKANREELEKLDRVTQQLYGRKPNEEEILKVREKQVDATRKLIDTNQQAWNLLKDTEPAKELRAQAAGAEALEKSIKAAAAADRAGKKDAKDAEREAKAAEKEREQFDKERRSNVMATGKLVLEGYEKEGTLIGQLHERVRALTLTEEERLALQVAAIEDPALRAYAEELVKQIVLAKEHNDQLKERNKLLQDQAAASKATLDDITRLEKQLEPRRRDMSRAEQLAATRKELARITPEESRGEVLARADAKIREALDTEAWQEWEDFATESLETVQDAITQFAFHGKMTFKDMTTAIAEDFFRMSLKMVMESAFSGAAGAGTGGSGGQGWLKVAFDAGLKLLGAASAAGGGGVGLTGGDAPGMQHGGPVTAGAPYVVGEAGPELFVPRQTGTIIPNGQMPGGTTVINVNVHGVQDVQGFHASRGALQRGIAGAVSQAYRGL
jgi:tape measure domain-containing protein